MLFLFSMITVVALEVFLGVVEGCYEVNWQVLHEPQANTPQGVSGIRDILVAGCFTD